MISFYDFFTQKFSYLLFSFIIQNIAVYGLIFIYFYEIKSFQKYV